MRSGFSHHHAAAQAREKEKSPRWPPRPAQNMLSVRALGGIRTPDPQIRSFILGPLAAHAFPQAPSISLGKPALFPRQPGKARSLSGKHLPSTRRTLAGHGHMAKHLTDSTIKRLPLPKAGNRIHYD